MSDNYTNSANYEQNAPRTPSRLSLINCEDLSDMRFRTKEYAVEGLLSPGLAVLAGSPKVGKSWLVLQLCMAVASGTPFLGMKVRQGTALYLALEDTHQRLQKRMLKMADDFPESLYFAVSCSSIGDDLTDELGCFMYDHPDTRLIVIDTFQKIRGEVSQMSYANDYSEVSWLKRLADRMNTCILLVHHTRKLGDSDAFNEINGTNGIAGSADTLMVLKKEKRTDRKASLFCTGRDIEDRELEIALSRGDCVWEVKSDSYSPQPEQPLSDDMKMLVRYVYRIRRFEGPNAQFTEAFNSFASLSLTPDVLKRRMNKSRYELENYDVQFLSSKTHGVRKLIIGYFPDSLKGSGGRVQESDKADASPQKSPKTA